MATKSITIDVEAYRRLKSVQRENESFSQTIKRVVPEQVSTDELIKMFRRAGSRLSESFYRGVEAALASRERSPADEVRDHGVFGHDRPARPRRKVRPSKAGRRGSKAKAA
jgi:predicted CopG family antitoxin